MLGRHKGTFLACSINRPLHDTLGTARIVRDILGWVQDILKPVRAADHLLRTVIVHAEFIEHLRCDCVTHM